MQISCTCGLLRFTVGGEVAAEGDHEQAGGRSVVLGCPVHGVEYRGRAARP